MKREEPRVSSNPVATQKGARLHSFVPLEVLPVARESAPLRHVWNQGSQHQVSVALFFGQSGASPGSSRSSHTPILDFIPEGRFWRSTPRRTIFRLLSVAAGGAVTVTDGRQDAWWRESTNPINQSNRAGALAAGQRRIAGTPRPRLDYSIGVAAEEVERMARGVTLFLLAMGCGVGMLLLCSCGNCTTCNFGCPAASGTYDVLSQVADSKHDFGTGYGDILCARICTDASELNYVFWMFLGQPVPAAPDDGSGTNGTAFIWALDTDMDAATGWHVGDAGTDFHVRLAYDPGNVGTPYHGWKVYIDVMWGGLGEVGPLDTYVLDGDIVQAVVPKSAFLGFSPAPPGDKFRWVASTIAQAGWQGDLAPDGGSVTYDATHGITDEPPALIGPWGRYEE